MTVVVSSTSINYASVRLTFSVEPLDTCITDTVTLRIYLGTSWHQRLFR